MIGACDPQLYTRDVQVGRGESAEPDLDIVGGRGGSQPCGDGAATQGGLEGVARSGGDRFIEAAQAFAPGLLIRRLLGAASFGHPLAGERVRVEPGEAGALDRSVNLPNYPI